MTQPQTPEQQQTNPPPQITPPANPPAQQPQPPGQHQQTVPPVPPQQPSNFAQGLTTALEALPEKVANAVEESWKRTFPEPQVQQQPAQQPQGQQTAPQSQQPAGQPVTPQSPVEPAKRKSVGEWWFSQ